MLHELTHSLEHHLLKRNNMAQDPESLEHEALPLEAGLSSAPQRRRKLKTEEYFMIRHFALVETANKENHEATRTIIAMVCFIPVLIFFNNIWILGFPLLCFGTFHAVHLCLKARQSRRSARAFSDAIAQLRLTGDIMKLEHDLVKDLAYDVDQDIRVKWARILVPDWEEQ
jgi:hypothetical protein